MWFAEMLTDFNAVEDVELGPKKEPALVAAVGNGFTMAWFAYAFYLIPLVVLFARISQTSRSVQQHAESTYVHASQYNPYSGYIVDSEVLRTQRDTMTE